MDGAPLGYLQTHGPAADPVTQLGWGLLGVSVAVIVIVGALLLGALWHRRAPLPPDADGRPPLTRDPRAARWISIGVSISSLVLLGCTVWIFTTLAAVARAPAARLTLDVVAHQWWWEVRYAGEGGTPAFDTANEIHIPVGEPVRLRLAGDDVIHSFWVPQLAGKTDVIPGVANTAWLQANAPGDYLGQCGEYCGAQHAHMRLDVIAEAPADFAAWRAQQAAAAADGGAAMRGRAVFDQRCGVCHRVRGTDAGGALGPDLTHLMSRRRIAAGTLPNDRAHLMAWIADAQAFKPGARMPRLALSGDELAAVVDYLNTLH
jgi:cytochrome c oxidase subunit 2